VHRDLKPENIMIKSLEERVVKLIDFDMAKETQAGVGSTMSTKGTREYMAPEVQKNGGCSVASDMWALALVALFIFSGKTPTESSDIRKIEERPHPLGGVCPHQRSPAAVKGKDEGGNFLEQQR
jgi:serine/threonine protein kinase